MKARFFMEYYEGFVKRSRGDRERMERARRKKR